MRGICLALGFRVAGVHLRSLLQGIVRFSGKGFSELKMLHDLNVNVVRDKRGWRSFV